MLRSADFLKYVLLLGGLLALATQAHSRDTEAAELEAQRLLRKIPLAAQSLNYSGTFTYQQGSQLRTSRITHVVQGKTELEKLEILDGNPREYVRKNEEIVFYAPDAKAMLIEQRVTREGFPAILTGDPHQVLAHYRVHLGETGRVADYDCQTVLLEPRDSLRYGYRLWVEKSSGLLLRAETLVDNKVIEQIGFTQLAVGNISSQMVRPSYPNVRDWRVERSALRHVEMPDLDVGFIPPGFKQTVMVKRKLTPAATPASAISGAPEENEAVQLVFSDGLAAISIFVEPGIQGGLEGFVQQGAVNITGKRLGDFWLTIVGEVPMAAVKQVASSVEFKSHK